MKQPKKRKQPAKNMLVEEDGGGKMEEEKKRREKEKNLTRNENSLTVDARRSLHTEFDDGFRSPLSLRLSGRSLNEIASH